MKLWAVVAVSASVVLAACAGKINNRPADMPGSPAEAEQMEQDNTPDKAPPDPSAGRPDERPPAPPQQEPM